MGGNDKVYNLLKQAFPDANVEREWDVAGNSLDSLTRSLCCLRVDFAVDP